MPSPNILTDLAGGTLTDLAGGALVDLTGAGQSSGTSGARVALVGVVRGAARTAGYGHAKTALAAVVRGAGTGTASGHAKGAMAGVVGASMRGAGYGHTKAALAGVISVSARSAGTAHAKASISGVIRVPMRGHGVATQRGAPSGAGQFSAISSGRAAAYLQTGVFAIVGKTLTAAHGTWLNSPTFSYQWNRAGTAIVGATSSTYTPVTADVGSTLTVSVKGTNSGGYVTATSTPTGGVIPTLLPVPLNLTLPIATGIGQVGNVLSATTGTWGNSPTTYAYQWYRNASPIVSQTASTYTVIIADIGQTITVGVTATNASGSASATNTLPVFGVYSSTLGGGATSILSQLPTQEQNHANPSPDGKWVAFTTYNHFVGGIAQESGGALNTEIRLINLSTLAITSAIAPNASYENAWPSWWPDSLSFIYKTTQGTSGGHEAIWRYVLGTGASSFYDPGDINITSSSVNSAGDIVLAGTTTVAGGFQGYLYTLVSGTRTQLTNPPITTGVTLGDSAPSWSHDKTKVACLRQITLGIFHIVVIGVGVGPGYANNSELVITPNGSALAIDGIPQWSSDDSKIIFYHIDPAATASNGIYTMNPDGSGRAQITNLPAEFADTLVNFMPGGGSSSSAPIVFSGHVTQIIDLAPVNTGLPVITGTVLVGNVLTASTGMWVANTGPAFSYQWLNAGAPISGATTSSYTVQSTDIGAPITVQVKATNSGGAVIATSLSVEGFPIIELVFNMSLAFPVA